MYGKLGSAFFSQWGLARPSEKIQDDGHLQPGDWAAVLPSSFAVPSRPFLSPSPPRIPLFHLLHWSGNRFKNIADAPDHQVGASKSLSSQYLHSPTFKHSTQTGIATPHGVHPRGCPCLGNGPTPCCYLSGVTVQILSPLHT